MDPNTEVKEDESPSGDRKKSHGAPNPTEGATAGELDNASVKAKKSLKFEPTEEDNPINPDVEGDDTEDQDLERVKSRTSFKSERNSLGDPLNFEVGNADDYDVRKSFESEKSADDDRRSFGEDTEPFHYNDTQELEYTIPPEQVFDPGYANFAEIPGEYEEGNYHADGWLYPSDDMPRAGVDYYPWPDYEYGNNMYEESLQEYVGEEESPRIHYHQQAIGDTTDIGEEKVSLFPLDVHEEKCGQGDGYCDSESDNSNWDLPMLNEMIAREKELECRKPWDAAADFVFTKRTMKKFFICSPGHNDSELQLPGNVLFRYIGRRVCNSDLMPVREAIPECRNISYINLAYNDIDDNGADYLGAILVDYGNIERLNLTHNNLTSKGLLKLVTLLIRRAPLFELKLTGMKIGDDVGVGALLCLILSGRCPTDLDLSECDLNLEALQKLCTAWQAMDLDVDYPPSLVNLNLPFTLSELQSAKAGYNKDKEDSIVLHQRKMGYDSAPAIHAVKDGFLAQIFENNEPGNMVEEMYHSLMKDHHDVPSSDLIKNFSTSLMEGLFELRNIREAKYEIPQQEIEDYDESKVAMQAAKEMIDVAQVVEEFQSIKNARERGEEPLDENQRPIIVSPSLYLLETFDDTELDFVHPDHEHQVKHTNALYIDFLLNRSGKPALHDDEEEVSGAIDENAAQKAAVRYTAETFFEAATITTTHTGLPDSTNISQLMLMIILDTIDRVSNGRGTGDVFTEEMVCTIIEEGVEKVEKILFPQVPSDCSVSIADLRVFLKQLFVDTHSTFTALMDSPFLGKTMREVSSVACREVRRLRGEHDQQGNVNKSTTSVDEEQLRLICIGFLDGTIKEAARIIGVGDPYGFQLHDKTEEDIEPYLDLKENIETEVLPSLDGIFEESAKMAAAATEKIAWIHREEAIYHEAGRRMVEDVFQDVTDAVLGIPLVKDKSAEYKDPMAPKKYQYISRPTRLILNRPLFAGNEEIIGAKMADYLKTNSSVKILHLRKWGLGEDGTQALMEGIMMNCNLVTLDLASNKIGPEGVRPIAEYVKKTTNLKHLLLNHNQLRNPGIKLITDAMNAAHSCSLVTVNVAYNDIDESGLDPFLLAVRYTNVKAVYVIGNRFSENSWHILNDLFSENKLSHNMTDIALQEVDGELRVVRNAQVRDMNEWYEVPPLTDTGLSLPPYYNERIDLLQNPLPIPHDVGKRFDEFMG